MAPALFASRSQRPPPAARGFQSESVNARTPEIRFRRITTPFGTMVLKEHQYLDVSWQTTSPTQGLEDNSLHPDLVLAIERWCTGLLVNVEPWLPQGEDFTSRVRRACAQIPWGKPEPTVSLPNRPAPPKPVARWDKPCVETPCLCSSPATVLWAPLVWVDTP